MEIWAKSNGIFLKEHTQHLLEAIEKLPYEKVKIQISKKDFKELLKLAVCVHDLGKVSPAFQKVVKNPNFTFDLQDFPYIRHNILSLFFINKSKIKELCNGNESIYATFLSAIAFHHWKTDEKEYLLHINDDLMKAAKLLCEDNNGKKLEEILKKHFGNGVNGINISEYITFDENLAEHIANGGNLISINIIPPYTLYFLPERLRIERQMKIDLNLWIFLSGFLMRADHFASLVEQKEFFFINLSEIEKGVKKIDLENKLKEKFRENFWQKESINYKCKNIILIAPTGIGKTEFALLWAEGEKFFYTLPLRAATNQIFERVCGYFNKNVQVNNKDPFIKEDVGLLHSDADLYLIEKSENLKKDMEGEILKILDLSKHLSLPINISTGDQIFPAALKYPQYEKIYATLGFSKLIIDEVQAYDPKACAIIVKMIEEIVSLGGKFLLMTATLPTFVKGYLKQKGVIKDDNIINCYNPNNKIGVTIKIDYRHKIELRDKDIGSDIEEIESKAKQRKRILVVLNTIEKAEEIYKQIKEKIKDTNVFIGLIHSKFTLNQRKQKEKELEEKFKNPKSPDENESKILVSTQVIEASLDIDADYLYTEVAPIDSLIQRMGRIMRRVDILTGKIKNTNKGFQYEDFYNSKEANVYIYYQEKENKKINLESGKGKVYPYELLDKTLKILKNKTDLDEKEKQNLVEKVYEELDEKSDYLKEFYTTLSILDSGYVSENKDEAHNIFREIFTIPVITKDNIEKIVEKINDGLQKNKISWLWFKSEIIAEYVINENMWKYKEWQLEKLWDCIEDKIRDIQGKNKDKIKKYCEGIWVLK